MGTKTFRLKILVSLCLITFCDRVTAYTLGAELLYGKSCFKLVETNQTANDPCGPAVGAGFRFSHRVLGSDEHVYSWIEDSEDLDFKVIESFARGDYLAAAAMTFIVSNIVFAISTLIFFVSDPFSAQADIGAQAQYFHFHKKSFDSIQGNFSLQIYPSKRRPFYYYAEGGVATNILNLQKYFNSIQKKIGVGLGDPTNLGIFIQIEQEISYVDGTNLRRLNKDFFALKHHFENLTASS